jgi:cytochrome c-type biogenesis protein CcmH/NrfG
VNDAPRHRLPPALIGAGLMAFLLVLYLVLAGQRATLFLMSGEPIAIAIGIALLVLPVLGAWALTRELLFGVRSQQLADRLSAEGQLPAADLPLRPSGRPERAAADAQFPAFRDAVEQAPEDWRAWFRLGLAYDASGDRRRARQAVRQAIALFRRQRA